MECKFQRVFIYKKHKILKLVILALDKTQYIVYTGINEQMFVLFCGVEQWEFAGLIIRKSQVRFLPPQPLGIEPNFRKSASERELYKGCKSPYEGIGKMSERMRIGVADDSGSVRLWQ